MFFNFPRDDVMFFFKNRMKLKFFQCFLSSLILLAFLVPARAQLVVGVSGGNFKPISIAVRQFLSADGLGKDISDIISADLERSGLFRPLDSSLFLEENKGPNVVPSFTNWQQIGAQAVVLGGLYQQADGRLRVDFRLWDVNSGRQLEGRQFFVTKSSYRRVAHMIADVIYTRMTGESAYFDSRIVFIDESGPKNARVRRLAIMDQDGANLHYLTNGSELILTPRFSPERQEVTYIAYVDGVPRVYIQNIQQGTRHLVGKFPNMTIAPRFSPDGKTIIMSLLQNDGSANLYTMDLVSRATKRLTATKAIDTSASYAPSGKEIVFSSDREGRPALYVMNDKGGEIRRISQGTGSYLTPVWSPRGDYIAFTKQEGGTFSIGVMRPDGSGERVLTAGFYNEGPTWSPNGRVLMFFRQDRGSALPKIYTIDLTGRNERQVPTPTGASDPAWSSLLK